VAYADLIALTVVCTVTLSIIAHGITANPLVDALATSTSHSAVKTAVKTTTNK